MQVFAALVILLTPAVAPLFACPIGKAKNTKEIPLQDGMLKLGTLQVTAKNQDPVVAFYRENKLVFCSADYDTSPVDARAVAATADKDHVYVVFTADGGSNHAQSFARFTRGGWLPSYGAGGGPKVLVVLKIQKADGKAVAGTYLTAKKKDGKTNSLAIKKIQFANNAVEINADAWYSPLQTDKKPFECSGASPFAYTVRLSSDLKTALAASAPACR